VWTPSGAYAPAAPARAAALQQAPRTTPLAYGFQGDFFQTAGRPPAIAAVKEAGFGWAKQQVQWADYEIRDADCAAAPDDCLSQTIGGRAKHFRKRQLGFLDAVVDDLSGAGLRVLLSVVRAPDFVAAPGGHSPANPRDLADFVQFLASRYAGKVQAIEPWNEQNLSWEWGGARLWPNAPSAPPQGVVDFVALQRAAYQGIKAGDPRITVVMPALTPTGLRECWLDPAARTQEFCLNQVRTAIDDRLYLDFLYQVDGGAIKGAYDVLGVHPSGYNNPPDDWVDTTTVSSTGFMGHGSFYIRRYQQLHEVQVKYGDAKPMWFTEAGWSVAPHPAPGYEYARDNTEQIRGAYVARLLEQVYRDAPYVTAVFLWNLNFRSVVPETDEKYGFGLVNADGSRTLAYLCAADFVRSGNQITRSECRSANGTAAGAAIATPAPASTDVPTALPSTSTPTPPPPPPTATESPTMAATSTVASTATSAATTTTAPAVTPTMTPTVTATAAPTQTLVTTSTATAAASPLSTSTAPPAATGTATPTLAAGSTAAATVTPAPLPATRPSGDTAAPAGAQPATVQRASLTTPAATSVPPAGAPAPSQPPLGGATHTLVWGDTLYSLARRHGTTVDALVAANGLGSAGAVLPVGRTLAIP
jgi:LysM repeat protein